MKYCLIAGCLFLITSCTKKTERPAADLQSVTKADNDFFPNYQYGGAHADTLYFYARLDDCGEWGGPEDEFKIYRGAKQYCMEYKRFRFNCDSTGYYYGLKKLPVERRKIIALNEKGKAVVSDFFAALMKAKIKEKVQSNAGSIYRLRSSDSTLDVYIYSEKQNIKEEFYRFKKKLGIPENRAKGGQVTVPVE